VLRKWEEAVYDVIIIGAGPAGGMAARQISKKGYKILIIDKKKVVGVPVQCGEGMNHFALEENDLKPNDSWINKRVKGVKCIVPNGKYFYSNDPGYSIDRAKFDQWIMNHSLDNGTEILLNTKVNGIEKKNDKWIAKTKNGSYGARILIGADGFASNVARWLGIMKKREFIKAIEYKFRYEDFDYPEEERLCVYYGERFNKGYGWVFPRGDEWNVGVGGSGDNKEKLKNFLKFLGADEEKRTEIIAGAIPHHYILSSLTKNGVMIVGDAAGMTNPTFGGGIHTALSSGRISGEVACKALEEENLGLIEEYNIRMKKEPYLKPIVHKCDECFKNWSDEDFNFLGNMMEGIDQSELTIFKGFIKMLKYPKYFARSRELLLLRKAMRINQKYGW
jgi:digeranylgeranylglycerophospholipid reductase